MFTCTCTCPMFPNTALHFILLVPTNSVFCSLRIFGKKFAFNEAWHQFLLQTSRNPMIQLGMRSCKYCVEFGISLNKVRLIKKCLYETCSRVRVGKRLSGMLHVENSLKEEPDLSVLLFNFHLE